MGVKHIVNLSGGACSFWTALRVADRFGTGGMTLLFADVLIEDKQLYELNDWTADYLGIPITRVSLELTPWELFRRQGIIANSYLPICSVMLKREPLDKWHRLNCTPRNSLFGEPDTIYIGFDWTEINRLNDLRAAKPEWQITAPMCEWSPLWDKNKMLCEMEKLVGWIPDAYKQGFPHFNCGKRCVRAGITHFVHLYKVDRPAFIEWENEEQRTIEELTERGIAWLSVLKDRRGGKSTTMTFRQLRERIEANDSTLPKDDWGGCGCGTQVAAEEKARDRGKAESSKSFHNLSILKGNAR